MATRKRDGKVYARYIEKRIVDASEVYFWLMRITFLISNLKVADTENNIANLIKGVEGAKET